MVKSIFIFCVVNIVGMCFVNLSRPEQGADQKNVVSG